MTAARARYAQRYLSRFGYRLLDSSKVETVCERISAGQRRSARLTLAGVRIY